MAGQNEVNESIVDRIYGAATDPSEWLEVVREVGHATGGFGGALVLWDTAKKIMPVTHNQGFPEEFWHDYRHNYINIDPRGEGFLRRPNLEVYADLMLIDAETRAKSEVMNFFRRETDQQHGYGARLFAGNGYESMLILERTAGQGEAQKSDLDRLTCFVPHLRRSIKIARKIGERLSVAAFDAMSFGILALDELGQVSFANKALTHMAAEGDGLSLSRRGLTLARTNEDAAYRGLVETMRRRAYLDRNAQRIALPASRPSGKRPYSILVCPFPRSDSIFPTSGPTLLVCVSDPAQTSHLTEDILTALFGLSPSEGRLAIALVKYGMLDAAAGACGLTEGSARQYVKRILAKTGARGQTDIVALLSGSVRL